MTLTIAMFKCKVTPKRMLNILNLLLLVNLTNSSPNKYFVDGDLILGALMPVHDYNQTSGKCEGILAIPYIKRVEALVYAVDKINRDYKILPAIKLGFDIRDTCYYEAVALGESVNFVLDQEHANERETCSDGCLKPPPASCKDVRNISGVVGAQRSSSSIQAATAFGLFNVPQISYLSTSDELSDKIKYKYFLRTVPPDRFQVNAMIDLVLHFNWTYVSILYSDDSYGRNGYSEFQKQSADRICLAVEEAISANSDIRHIVQMLLDRGAVTVVLFLGLESANEVYDAVERLNATDVFVWVASDAVGNAGVKGISEHKDAAEGTFTMVPFSERLPAFDLKFFSSTPSTSPNPWFPEYYEGNVNCSLKSCIIDDDDTDTHDTLVMDSVYAFAYALDSIQRSVCKGSKPSSSCVGLMQEVPGKVLLEELRRTSFDSLANGRVEFDSGGDIQGRYRMSYFQRDPIFGKLRSYPIGTWTTDGFSDFNDEITWSVRSSINGSIPRSQCSETCQPGFQTVLIYERVKCCWECKECTGTTVVDPNGNECKECNATSGPDAMHMECLLLDTVYVSWGNHLGSLILVTASIGLVAILIVLVFFIYYRNEQILQTSEPLLNYLILLGEAIVLMSTITFAVKPNEGICTAARLLPAVGACMMYSAMALKSIRLQKIFIVAFTSDSTQHPKLIQTSKQLGILFITLSIQIALSLIWLLLYPPAVLPLRKIIGDTARIELSCNIQINEVITSLAYNLIFIIICCASVFKARRLPDNYYESRFLSFCSFTTVVILLTFLPPYFVSDEKELFTKCIYIACGLILNCWIVLICIFVIKIYAIRYVKPVEETPGGDTRLRSSTTVSTRTLVNSMYLQRRSCSYSGETTT